MGKTQENRGLDKENVILALSSNLALKNPVNAVFTGARSGWDSNPRALAGYLISSQGRYDHFDTTPMSGLFDTADHYTTWPTK